MPSKHPQGSSRRDFLKVSGAIAAAGLSAAIPGCNQPVGQGEGGGAGGRRGVRSIVIDTDPDDRVLASAPAQWGLGQLRAALKARSIEILPSQFKGTAPDLVMTVSSQGTSMARQLMDFARAKMPYAAESLAIVPVGSGASRGLLVTAFDPNGMAYALSDLADAIRYGNPHTALSPRAAIIEQPANKVRSICRVFVSEEEDKPWYYDREGWKKYFDMLATNRFNKFNLSLGLAYDFSDNVVDGYFFFAYPFFLRLQGYDVRAVDRAGKPLPDAEQDRNLATLQFISKEAAARGIHFQLGLWTHSIRWPRNQGVTANYTLTGITPATQAPYSRDALKALLEACPDVKGVTIRTHGESGIPEGDISLWKTVFDGTKDLANDRKVQIDLHAKGITFEIIDAARATGNPVIVTPKFWAEHNGLPYIPASIREWELPKATGQSQLMALSTGSRNHMRYGYGDILIKDREYGVVTRVFPGTQRFLLWGDPVYARAYAKIFSFNNMDGVEWFEPLAFKGRQGTGMARNRGCYADAELAPEDSDQMDKYEYTFRLWGRTAYNPDVDAAVWQRKLAADCGPAGGPLVEAALAPASRILPLVTAAHSPSAAQANFWPEIYTNMSHHDATRPTYADDTPAPKVFGTVSSLDPQLFATAEECAVALLASKGIGKITLHEVAAQLDRWAAAVEQAMPALKRQYTQTRDKETLVFLHRAMIDAALAGAMGRFWAAKFRTGVYYAIFDHSNYQPARDAALREYAKARDAMAQAARLADPSPAAPPVYIKDISFGRDGKIRGSWSDRLAHIDNDIAGMRTATARNPSALTSGAAVALSDAQRNPPRPVLNPTHTPPAGFTTGAPIPLTLDLPRRPGGDESVRLWYRHINQAETYQSAAMTRTGATFAGTIPAEYTSTPYNIQYYFEIERVTPNASTVALYPGFREDFLGMPYFTVAQPTTPKSLDA